MTIKFPDSNSLEASVLRALKSQNGVAQTKEIDNFVSKDLGLTNEQLELIRSGNRTEIQYRLAWIRTKAKGRGLIEKGTNGTWTLTTKGLQEYGKA